MLVSAIVVLLSSFPCNGSDDCEAHGGRFAPAASLQDLHHITGLDCEIVMLHVATSGRPLEAGSMPAPGFIDHAHYDWTAWQREFEMRFSHCSHGARHRVDMRVGNIGEAILAEASESHADLIAITWKKRFAEGSAPTARCVLEGSPCPLLVVGQRPVDAP